MANVELFQDDVALISGANKGIGYEIARGLGAKKIKVLVGARDEGRGQAAVDKLKAEGADARFIQLDVTDPGTIQRAAGQIEKEFGRLDILINNAGTAEWGFQPSNVALTKVREVYETNFFGPVALIQAMLPLLQQIEAWPHRERIQQPGLAHAFKRLEFAVCRFPLARLQHIEIGAE